MLCKATRHRFHTANKRPGVSVDECEAVAGGVLIAKDQEGESLIDAAEIAPQLVANSVERQRLHDLFDSGNRHQSFFALAGGSCVHSEGAKPNKVLLRTQVRS